MAAGEPRDSQHTTRHKRKEKLLAFCVVALLLSKTYHNKQAAENASLLVSLGRSECSVVEGLKGSGL